MKNREYLKEQREELVSRLIELNEEIESLERRLPEFCRDCRECRALVTCNRCNELADKRDMIEFYIDEIDYELEDS